jgi:hypothetical protein
MSKAFFVSFLRIASVGHSGHCRDTRHAKNVSKPVEAIAPLAIARQGLDRPFRRHAEAQEITVTLFY